MLLFIPSEAPSALLRQQVRNISFRMRDIAAKTILSPLRSMRDFYRIEAKFVQTERDAYLCCSVMDQSWSIEAEERATNAMHILLTELVNLKNEAGDLLESETTGIQTPWRF